MTAPVQQDESCLSDQARIRELAIWLLACNHPVAAAFREKLGTRPNNYPTEADLRRAYSQLYEPDTNVSTLDQAFRSSRTKRL